MYRDSNKPRRQSILFLLMLVFGAKATFRDMRMLLHSPVGQEQRQDMALAESFLAPHEPVLQMLAGPASLPSQPDLSLVRRTPAS